MTTQYVEMPVRTNTCAAAVTRGFLVLWIPLSPEVKQTVMSDLLPLRIGNMAKYECQIQYGFPLSQPPSVLTEEESGWIVVTIQKEENDIRKSTRMILRNCWNENLMEVSLKDTYLRRVRIAYLDPLLNPQMQFNAQVELVSPK